MVNKPDRLYIDLNSRPLYEKLESEPFFKGKTRKEQFLFAMAVGFKNKIKIPIEKREGIFLTKDLKPEDEALINAIAIFDANSIDILLDKAQVFKIVEEYANGGIRILINKIDSIEIGTFEKYFEKDLFDLNKI